MSITRSFGLGAAVAILAACAGDSPDPAGRTPDLRRDGNQAGITLSIKTADVRTDGSVKFDFVNGSTGTVTTGLLDCVNSYELRDGEQWRSVGSLRMCIEIAEVHLAGETSSHETPAPEQPGTYRLVVQGWLDSTNENMVVRSTPFEVRK